MLLLIKNEWRQLARTKILQLLLVVLFVITAFIIYSNVLAHQQLKTQREIAAKQMRNEFLAQGETNPHNAAHFGHYVFKPYNFLQVVDNGVDKFTGTTLRLEAHQQNETVFSASQSSSSLIRFGDFSFALLLQIIFPLLLIFLCHNCITTERENGTFKLLIGQGQSIRKIIWAKISAYTLVITAALILLTTAFYLLIQSVFSANSSNYFTERLIYMLALYATYYFIIIAFTVTLSAKFKTAKNVLVTMLGIWLLCTIIIPKAAANIGDMNFPLVSKIDFEKTISEENKKGINGHDPSDVRVKRLQDSLLNQYKVDSLNKLPINVDGITMQADETYHNIVYDKYLGQLEKTIASQNNISSNAAIINPFLAIRNISMSLAQTDVYHHFNFTSQAEQYRRMLMKKLNDEFAYGGAKTGDWDWKVKANYWQGINDFTYLQPTIYWSMNTRKTELLAIVCWLFIAIAFVTIISNTIKAV